MGVWPEAVALRLWIVFLTAFILHCLILFPFTGELQNRPIAIKLGYLPDARIIKPLAGDLQLAVAHSAVVKVLFYYGTWVQKFTENVIFRPELANMYQTLTTAARVDPYNMDVYYFSQAAFTWEVGRFKEVNELLEYGMKYRTWDPWLPFYLGFNHSYFLKDNVKAAKYYKLAAEKSDNPLFTKLASRYYYESNQIPLALVFLEGMIKGAKDPVVRKMYEIRYRALAATQVLQQGVDEYKTRYGTFPERLQDLIETHLIADVPEDPYGGKFFVDENGRVRTTSNMANPDAIKP